MRAFVAGRVVPFHDRWEREGMVDRSLWVEAGTQGLLGIDVPEEHGDGGTADFRYDCVVDEELVRVGATGVGFTRHNDVVAPCLLGLTTPEQQECWLPRSTSGEMIIAIAMTEPGAGSDLQGLRTTARRDGDDWVLSGSKARPADRVVLGQPLHPCRDGDRARDRAHVRRPRGPRARRRALHGAGRRDGHVVDDRAAEAGRDTCVQLHGGDGYVLEHPVAKAYLDARVQTISGGTTEVMKEIIGRSLGV